MASNRRKRRSQPARPATGNAVPAFWSGTISFGLVSIPVSLLAAHRSRARGLRMLAPDGTPLQRRYVCPAHDEPVAVDDDDIVRGHAVAGGEMVTVTDDELASLEPRKSRDIELQRFVDRAAIPRGMLQRAYYLAPAGDSTRAYHLLASVLEEHDRAAIARFVMRSVEYPVAITGEAGVLRAFALRFPDELRTPESLGLPDASPPDRAAVRRIGEAIDALTRDRLDPDEMRDESGERLAEIAADKLDRGEDVVQVAEDDRSAELPSNVIDIMQLLKQQLEADDASGGRERGDGAGGRRTRRDTREPRTRRKPRGMRRRDARADELSERTRQELYEQAQRLDIAGRSKMTKQELIAAIRDAG